MAELASPIQIARHPMPTPSLLEYCSDMPKPKRTAVRDRSTSASTVRQIQETRRTEVHARPRIAGFPASTDFRESNARTSRHSRLSRAKIDRRTRLQSELPRRARQSSESTCAEFLFRLRWPCTARRTVSDPDRSPAPNRRVLSNWQPRSENSRRAAEVFDPALARCFRIQRLRFSELYAAIASGSNGARRSVSVPAQTRTH